MVTNPQKGELYQAGDWHKTVTSILKDMNPSIKFCVLITIWLKYSKPKKKKVESTKVTWIEDIKEDLRSLRFKVENEYMRAENLK